MLERPVNDRDWVRRVISHEAGLAVPYNFSLSPPARAALETHFGTRELAQHLRFPLRTSSLKSIKPQYPTPAQYGPSLKDEFGVVWSTNEIDRGSPVGACLPEPDLSKYRFPDATATYRFEDLAQWASANSSHFTILWVGDLWERATFMRGMENILLDLSLEPAFLDALLRGLTDYILTTMKIAFDMCSFDAIALSDDYGQQHGMMMSPAHWRRFIKPLLAEIYAFAKQHGRIVYHHTCGHVVPIIGEMIDLGMDILQPIQPEAMDVYALKKEFGKRLSFCGGLGTQELLPKGPPERIRQEVRRLKDELGNGGGYILEPGITLQADIPLANMLAAIEESQA